MDQKLSRARGKKVKRSESLEVVDSRESGSQAVAMGQKVKTKACFQHGGKSNRGSDVNRSNDVKKYL
jgi:hypothetical protein